MKTCNTRIIFHIRPFFSSGMVLQSKWFIGAKSPLRAIVPRKLENLDALFPTGCPKSFILIGKHTPCGKLQISLHLMGPQTFLLAYAESIWYKIEIQSEQLS